MDTSRESDTTEAIELCATRCLYLKPIVRLTINVMLPEFKEAASPLSNEDILEQLKNAASPDHFSNLSVFKITQEFIQIDGETETKTLAKILLEKLHGSVIKVNGLEEDLSVQVTEAQIDFLFPQDPDLSPKATGGKENGRVEGAQNPPLSLHLEGLPCQWFLSTDSNDPDPSEDILRMVFERFGTVANVYIPMLDPCIEDVPEEGCEEAFLRSLKTFEAYVQYEDYEGFEKAVGSLRGMKLLFKGDDGKSVACNVKVTLDTTNHFSESAISQRRLERLQLLEQERTRKNEEEAERERKDKEGKCCEETQAATHDTKAQEQEKLEDTTHDTVHPRENEELWLDGTEEWEERKLVLAQRRVESMKLLTILLGKVQGEAVVALGLGLWTGSYGSRYVPQSLGALPLHPDSQDLTSFMYHNQKWKHTCLPLGYCESPSIFNRVKQMDLSNIETESTVLQDVDDILICSETEDRCNEDSVHMLTVLADKGYKMDKAKLQYYQKEVLYIGQMISKDGRHIAPKRAETIRKTPQPTTEYVLLDNFSKELLLNFELDKGRCQATGGKDVENRETTSEIILDDDLDWEKNSEWELPSEGNGLEDKEEAYEGDKEAEEEGGEDEKSRTYLSISSSVSSYDSMTDTSTEEMESYSPDKLWTETDNHKYDYNRGCLQVAMKNVYRQTENQAGRANWNAFRGSNYQDINVSVCYKKPKIYETDEFINYLLNYYEYPAYTRICLEHKSTESQSWWQRFVFNNGSGFQVNLINLYELSYTKVNMVHSVDQQTPRQKDNSNKSIVTRRSMKRFKNKFSNRSPKDFPTQCVQAKPKLASATQRPLQSTGIVPLKSCEDRQSKIDPSYQGPGLAHELMDVLEKISSDSEYFSEVLEDPDKRPKRLCKDDCRLGWNTVEMKNRIRNTRPRAGNILNSVKAKTHHPSVALNCFGLQFSDAYNELKSHCTCKRREQCKRPSGILQSEEQNSEYESTDDNEMDNGNIDMKMAHRTCLGGGDHYCFENGNQNPFSCLQKRTVRSQHLQRLGERSNNTQHKAKLKAPPHRCTATAHPFQINCRGARQSAIHHAYQQDVTASAPACKYCQRVEPFYDYCYGNCDCYDHSAENYVNKTEQLPFCPKSFNDYLGLEHYYYGSPRISQHKLKKKIKHKFIDNISEN
ncbi:A-kinase anchor protein 17B-like [Ambystoma mexicanum]|uniref:A-kinase anchor protein 17B-like n=1 Tax=Ambystoma mexicanum TaxID=8296 RepID=UPI0037E804ED